MYYKEKRAEAEKTSDDKGLHFGSGNLENQASLCPFHAFKVASFILQH